MTNLKTQNEMVFSQKPLTTIFIEFTSNRSELAFCELFVNSAFIGGI